MGGGEVFGKTYGNVISALKGAGHNLSPIYRYGMYVGVFDACKYIYSRIRSTLTTQLKFRHSGDLNTFILLPQTFLFN